MLIECEEDPWELIGNIGDPNFSICDESWDEIYRHKYHPKTLRITDCEENLAIDITGETIEDTLRIAQALCNLLNQDYYVPGKREKLTDGLHPPPWNMYDHPEKTEGWIEYQKEMRKDPDYYNFKE
jgi:hypothetical protein